MTTPTDRPNLDRLRELDKAATSGPWRATDSEVCDDMPASGMAVVPKGDYDPTAVALVCDEWYENDPGEPSPSDDATLIAAYRNATPALVAALTDVLALADQLAALAPDDDWGNSVTDTVLADAGRQFRRTITAHLDLTNGA